jgi:hypothetical protein
MTTRTTKWREQRWYILLWLPVLILATICAFYGAMWLLECIQFMTNPPNVPQGLAPGELPALFIPLGVLFLFAWVVVVLLYPRYGVSKPSDQ